MKKVIYITCHYQSPIYFPPKDMYPNFFTYGWGTRLGRMFKKFNSDWEVEIWRLDSSISIYMETIIDDIKIRLFPAKGNRHIGLYSRNFTKELKRQEESTIINIQNIHSAIFYQILFFAPKKLKIVGQHHGDWSPFFLIKRDKGLKKLRAYVYAIVELFLINRVTHFFIIDKDHVKYLKRSYKKGTENIAIQPVGIDINKYNFIPKEEACKILSLDSSKKYIFYLGAYYDLKEVDRLCDVYSKVKKEYPNVQLIVAGGRPTDQYYINLINCGAIDFGRILNTEVYKYYSVADVYVSMAFREDNFGGVGIAMLESMACNTPVVCKSLKNIPGNLRDHFGKMPNNEEEMVNDILHVLNNKDKYINCRNFIGDLYDYSVIQKNTAEVYNQILDITNSN